MLKYGNWCGPNWSAKQWKEAKDLTEEDKQVPAIDALDQACKNHDIGIAEGDPNANRRFWYEATRTGATGVLFALAVSGAGPSLHNTLRGGEEITHTMETRAGKRRKLMDEVLSILNEGRGLSAEDIDVGTEGEDMEVEGEVYTSGDSTFTTPTQPSSQRDPAITRGERPSRGLELGRSLINLLQNPNEARNTNMDTTATGPTAILATRSTNPQTQTNAGSGQRGNKETPVMYNARTELGIFTETRTAYLPLTVYLSINRTEIKTPIPLHFRVDWPHDIFKNITLARQQLPLLWSDCLVRNTGLSNDMVRHGLRATATGNITAGAGNFNTLAQTSRDPALNQGQLIPFPNTLVGSTLPTQGGVSTQGSSSYGSVSDDAAIPAHRVWYAKMYQYAHCMETDWKVTYYSGESNEEFQNMRVYEGMDCVSTGNTDTIPKTFELGVVDHWPYLKKHDLVCRTTEKGRRDYTISGTWKPDIDHPMKMVANTEEIKTWTKLGSEDFGERTPNGYREDVTLLHYSHPDSFNQAAFWNVRIDLRYKVQFKDLTNVLRWPRLPQTSVLLSSLDCLQTPHPTGAVGATENPERISCNLVTPR
jgi:hypothetical protein